MSNGTTGLGQDSTVFDFSGIGELGLQIDQMQEQKRQRRSAKFQNSAKGALEGVAVTGVRDIDKPFLSKEYNEWMGKAAKAMQTEDPALLAEANALKIKLSQDIASSQQYQKSWLTGREKTINSTSYSKQPDLYADRMEWYSSNTAMNEENNGEIGDAGFYMHQELIDYAPKDITTRAKEFVGAVKQAATDSTSYSGPTGGSSKTVINKTAALESADKQWATFLQSEEKDDLLFENYMIKETGRSWFEPQDVSRFQARLKRGEELKQQFASMEDLERSFKDSPLQLAEAKKAYNMENEMNEYGKENFVNTIMSNMDLGKKQSTTVKDPNSGSGSGNDLEKYGYAGGQSWSDIVNEDADLSAVGEVPEDFSIGKSSTKGGALRSFGKGKNTTYYEGLSAIVSPDFEMDKDGKVIDGEVSWVLNTRVPAEGELEQLMKGKAEGLSGAELLDFVDFTLKPVPLGKMSGDIPRGELNAMKKLAMQEAQKAQKAANESSR